MPSANFLADVRARTYKVPDSWWTVFLVDPIAVRLLVIVARWRFVTPNRLTMGSFVFGGLAAASFAMASKNPLLPLLGGLLFHLSFVLDCMDGKLARLQGTTSVFGEWFDFILDRIRVLICAGALMGGQYSVTQNVFYLYLGLAVIFLDMFRYLNGLQIHTLRNTMHQKLSEGADFDAEVLHQEFQARFGFFGRLRTFLARHRVRPHLFGGIEYHMAVFIIGPLTGTVLGVTLAASILFAIFELAVCYRFQLSTRDYVRKRAVPAAFSAIRGEKG